MYFRFILKVGLTAFFLWWLATKIDVTAALAAMARVPVGHLAAAAALLLLQCVLGGVRWYNIMTPMATRPALTETLRIYFIGLFFSQMLPSSIGGDGLRMYYAQRAGLTITEAVNGVLLDRLVALVAMVVLLVALRPLYSEWNNVLGQSATFMLFLLLAASLVGLSMLFNIHLLPRRILENRIGRSIVELSLTCRAVLLSRRSFLVLLVLGVTGPLILSLAAYITAIGMGAKMELITFLVLFPMVTLAAAMPVSFAGWGVREGAMLFLFTLAGLQPEHAVAVSVLAGLMGIAASLPGAWFWLRHRRALTAALSEEAHRGLRDEVRDGGAAAPAHSESGDPNDYNKSIR